MAEKYELDYKKYKDGKKETGVRRTHMGPDILEAVEELDRRLNENDPDYPDSVEFINEKHETIGVWLIVKVNNNFSPPVVFSLTVSRIP